MNLEQQERNKRGECIWCGRPSILRPGHFSCNPVARCEEVITISSKNTCCDAGCHGDSCPVHGTADSKNTIESIVREALQEEIADRVIYETRHGEELLRIGLIHAEVRLIGRFEKKLTQFAAAQKEQILDILEETLKENTDGWVDSQRMTIRRVITDLTQKIKENL